MTNLVLVDVSSEGLPEQVALEQVDLEQAQQDLLGQVDLEQAHQDQQGQDLQVCLDQALQV